MNRVFRTPVRRWVPTQFLLAVLFGLVSAGAAQAQSPLQRLFPAGSLKGMASFGAWPNISINCTNYTLGPGVRVLDAEQRVVLTGQLPGIESPVVFLLDATGNVFRVWLVSRKDPSLAAVPLAASNCGFGGS